MIKKKFKVRVVNHYQDRYQVQYAYYYLIPNWKSLKFWYSSPSYTSNLSGWTPKSFLVHEAEQIASKLKSIDDVVSYHYKDEKERIDYLIKKRKYLAIATPYRVKKF